MLSPSKSNEAQRHINVIATIFITPVFYNPKNKTYLDIVQFNNLNLTTKNNTIALGGINEKNLKRLKCTKAIGFAGISWIKKNRPKIN